MHVLDLARLLVGEVAEVHALAAGQVPADPTADRRTMDGAAAALLRFDHGAIGTLGATCTLGWKHRAGLEIVTDDLVLDVAEDALEVRDAHATGRSAVDPDVAKAAADRAFVDAVRRGPEPPPGPRSPELPDHAEAMRSPRLACALARSVRTGRPEAPVLGSRRNSATRRSSSSGPGWPRCIPCRQATARCRSRPSTTACPLARNSRSNSSTWQSRERGSTAPSRYRRARHLDN